jgi:hypothetical protein
MFTMQTGNAAFAGLRLAVYQKYAAGRESTFAKRNSNGKLRIANYESRHRPRGFSLRLCVGAFVLRQSFPL